MFTLRALWLLLHRYVSQTFLMVGHVTARFRDLVTVFGQWINAEIERLFERASRSLELRRALYAKRIFVMTECNIEDIENTYFFVVVWRT